VTPGLQGHWPLGGAQDRDADPSWKHAQGRQEGEPLGWKWLSWKSRVEEERRGERERG
jgi:hypothetical protein